MTRARLAGTLAGIHEPVCGSTGGTSAPTATFPCPSGSSTGGNQKSSKVITDPFCHAR
jgi:hypothetical protein